MFYDFLFLVRHSVNINNFRLLCLAFFTAPVHSEQKKSRPERQLCISLLSNQSQLIEGLIGGIGNFDEGFIFLRCQVVEEEIHRIYGTVIFQHFVVQVRGG